VSAAGEASRRAESGKQSGATGREAALALAGRSPRRSSLFWWLFDNHDELLKAKGMGGLGFAWKAMCPVFAELELTLAAGARHPGASTANLVARSHGEGPATTVGSGGGSRTRPPARAGSATQHAVWDSGRYEAPLAEVQPRRAVGQPPAQPVSNLPVIVREEGADLPADSSMIVMFQGEPLDLNIFVRPGVQEPWEKPGLSAEARQHIKLTMLTLRFEHWKKDRILDLNNPVDRERKRLNALRNAQR